MLRARLKKATRTAIALRRRRHTNRHGVNAVIVNRHNPKQAGPVNRRVRIDLPERLDLEDNYEETVTHLANVRRAAQRKFRLGYLSFDNIKYVSPSAALLLASEIDRWKSAVGERVSADHKNWDPSVCRLLCEMGFFELLRLKRPEDVRELKNTQFLPFIRGNVEERGDRAGRQAQVLRQRIEEAAGVQIRKHLLFAGLSEAITNVSQHAYSKKKTNREIKPWWMSAALVERKVIVSFYDHGRTIPGTLPSSKLFEKMWDSISAWHDGDRILAAMQLGRTSTGNPRRGKGLQNFLELIHAHPASQLRIFSNRGVLVVTNHGASELAYRSTIAQTCLRGTLIEWQFEPKHV